MASCCKNFTLVPSDCPCLMKLQDDSGNTIVLNLDGAIVRELKDNTGAVAGMNIQTPSGGVNIAEGSITLEEIETLICECSNSGGGGGGTSDTLIDSEVICLVPNGSPENTDPEAGLIVVNTNSTPATSTFWLNGVDVTATHTQVICPAGKGVTISTEIGCLSDSATIDLAPADRCAATRVIIGGTTSFIDLPLNWSNQELVDAVNAENPGSLTLLEGQIIRLDGETVASMQIVCDATTFTEDFGTGGSEGSRLTSANTDYTFKNTGTIGDGFYGITTFGDTGLVFSTSYNTANNTITADALGDTNGNAFVVNADFAPGEFYRQPITGLTAGLEYSVQFYAISTNDAARNDINPNISVSIVDTNTSLEIGNFETGDILRNDNGEWSRYAFDFTTTNPDIEFVLVNNAPGGRGNDLAIDQITFAAVNRESIRGIDVTSGTSVEIIKILDSLGNIEDLRVFSPDGQIEYEIPNPDGKVLTTGACGANTSNLVTWIETLCDDQGTKFQRFFTSLNEVVTHVDMDFEGNEYEVVGNVISCLPAEEKCMKSKHNAEFTSNFLAIEDAVIGSSDPVTAKIDGPMNGIFATIEMQNGTTWDSGASAGETITGVRVTPRLGSATITFDFPDACDGIIDVTRTRLLFWDLDGQGGSVNQEFVEFDTPFARVSDNLLIMNAPTNTIVGGVPGADAEHNWVEWDGLVDEIHLKRDPEIGGPDRGNIILEGIEIEATAVALYTGIQEPDGTWKYYDYQGNELTDPIVLARLRPCNEVICSEAGGVPQYDIEVQTLCDDNGPFMQEIYYKDGVRHNILARTADGVSAYVPVGDVTVCTGEAGANVDVELLTLCDDNGTFLRRLRYLNGVLDQTQNLELDGNTTYFPVGTVGNCEPAEYEPLGQVCYLDRFTGEGFTKTYSKTMLEGTVSTSPTVHSSEYTICSSDSGATVSVEQTGTWTTGWVPNPSTAAISANYDSGGNIVLSLSGLGTTAVDGRVSFQIGLSETSFLANYTTPPDEVIGGNHLPGGQIIPTYDGEIVTLVWNNWPGSVTIQGGSSGVATKTITVYQVVYEATLSQGAERVATALYNVQDKTITYIDPENNAEISQDCIIECDKTVASESVGEGVDVEQRILCHQGDRFIRHTRYDEAGVAEVWETTLDMVTPFIIDNEGSVEECGAAEDSEVVILCDEGNNNEPFMRHMIRDLHSGGVSIRDTELDGISPVTPTGQGVVCDTDCCDQVISSGCWDNGTSNGRWVSVLKVDGTVSTSDPVTGLTVSSTDILNECPEYADVQWIEVNNGGSYVVTEDYYSCTVTMNTGSATIEINGVVVTLRRGSRTFGGQTGKVHANDITVTANANSSVDITYESPL